ncbi:MAG: ABC transporter ATP-binding protein [Candidatus Eremiobacteraeota bacterium]|nr:ABC transporter ATP-binding protein [Candidatus Eremiobacteraeota bacterium]MCW5869385.1 ABC transporter ATP-binding protein [Candidatus Eremiobacteraeota bacterium]
MSADAPALEAVDLSKHYGSLVALDSLNLRIEQGEVFCLLGSNGAGKTTTVNLFLNLVEPTSGEPRILGHNVVRESRLTKSLLAYIPETVMLYPELTGLENLGFFASLSGIKATTSLLTSALEEAGLQPEAHARRVGGYSKGMRQKVGIALAIVKNARVLLLDEPTSGLDPKASNEFGELLLRLSARGTAILMVTHDIFRAKETGTRVGIMKAGRLVECLATSELAHSDLERLYLSHMQGRN